MDWSKRVSAVAVNDRFVAFTGGHPFLDGVSFLLTAERFKRGELVIPRKLPIAVDQHFAAEIESSLDTSEHVKSMHTLTSVPWSGSIVRQHPGDCRAMAIPGNIPSPTLKCYNPKTKRFVRLTDALWRTAILTGLALNPAQKGIGCSTWVSVREYIKEGDTGNLIAPLTIRADGISMDATVQDLDDALRRDFKDKMKKKKFLNALKATLGAMPVPRVRASFFDCSNVGYFETGGPFTDFWLEQTMAGRLCTSAIALGIATVFGGDNARVIMRYPCSPWVFTRSDAVRGYKAVVHSFQNLAPKTKLKDAIRELKEVAG
jgi:hypothetical protein